MITKKMAAKLTIHKFETGFHFKSLQININEGENDETATKFSEWLEGKTFLSKKDNEKSSRLVVKIVNGKDYNELNLDSCAKLIDKQDTPTSQGTNEFNNFKQFATNNKLMDFCIIEDENSFEINKRPKIGSVTGLINNFKNNENKSYSNAQSPLEYSLEKVKENNARIMENIHMLNRTLNYTKKKEILEGVPKTMQSFPCETCGKCFVYETGLKRHYAMRHAMTEPQMRWQVVWTCIKCFQVWPQQKLALHHTSCCCSSDSPESIQEIKTSLLLQCEFCERVFTSIPRLLRHSKTHTTQKSFECNACEISFRSYKKAEEHWLNCEWLKTSYSFSLPKMLLCNACDRKFRNYEQLYNHRYKIGHFMAKKNGSTISMYLYQCELCEMSFQSTSLLLVHKRESHPFNDTFLYNAKNCNDCNETEYQDYFEGNGTTVN